MMSEEKPPLLVVGLGNPGLRYANTRHNMGFLVVKAVADHLGVKLDKNKDFLGDFGSLHIFSRRVMFLLPMTFMNLSGQSVKRCRDFFKLPASQILVICDDIALEFGKLRIRERGSPGGHNGLKSVELDIGDPSYHRLRVGVGLDREKILSDYVLEPFKGEELQKLETVIQQAAEAVESYLEGGYTGAVKYIASLKKAPSKSNED